MGFSSKLSEYQGYALFSTTASVVTSATLVVMKSYAYSASGSASILASLMDSFSDLCVSTISFFSLHYALKPADKEHRHGHGNIEGITALFQSAIIAAAALFLGMESFSRFFTPVEITLDWLSILILVISIIMSAGLVWLQNHTLSRSKSLIVEADMANYSADVAVAIATLVVIILVSLGAPPVIDSIFAFLMALNLARISYSVGRKALDMLLDRELPDEQRSHIKSLIKGHPGVLSFHDLRTNQSGVALFISFDIAVNPDLSLREAHAIAKDVEASIMQEYPRAEVLIHVDPADDIDDARHKNF
ncbi:MAG: cation diffusion facilitator family transporter [Alphaproteobacteria bacterium]|nr:cation diffusion facilitator family transporter [Alphaproteobacteria bacterium]